ncbi:hypothetical protein [Sphaerisporangium aureirubrum]|uniref:Uncharacterized protein n=1 Tax=Sphaerisporangium aureirubrum TaxID=1544736 RepID=A0ABW1NKV8_9ACTN
MAETRAERMKAEGRMRAIRKKHELTEKEIKEMIPQMTEMVRLLGEADPADRNDLYTQMGLRLVYDPSERVVHVEARPSMYQSACPRSEPNQLHMPLPSPGSSCSSIGSASRLAVDRDTPARGRQGQRDRLARLSVGTGR